MKALIFFFALTQVAQAEISDLNVLRVGEALGYRSGSGDLRLTGKLLVGSDSVLNPNLNCEVVFDECGGLGSGGRGSICVAIESESGTRLASERISPSYVGGTNEFVFRISTEGASTVISRYVASGSAPRPVILLNNNVYTIPRNQNSPLPESISCRVL